MTRFRVICSWDSESGLSYDFLRQRLKECEPLAGTYLQVIKQGDSLTLVNTWQQLTEQEAVTELNWYIKHHLGIREIQQ